MSGDWREKGVLKWREGKGRVASREERGTACQNCEIEMLVGGGLECGIKIDQNVSVKTIEQEWNGKHKGERAMASERHSDGDER